MVSRTIWLIAGVMWLVEGIVAYVTDLNKIGAIILILIGIGGFIGAFRRERKEEEEQ